jgi:hypothetical protein
MKEQLISFETAKLAKDKGFDVKTDNWYRYDDILYGRNAKRGGLVPPISQGIGRCLAPTQSLLQKWLREECNIFVTILPWKDHGADVNDPITFMPMISRVRAFGEFLTWEQALEVGLQEALKLIEV